MKELKVLIPKAQLCFENHGHYNDQAFEKHQDDMLHRDVLVKDTNHLAVDTDPSPRFGYELFALLRQEENSRFHVGVQETRAAKNPRSTIPI